MPAETQDLLGEGLMTSDWLGTVGMMAAAVVVLFLLTRWIKKGRPKWRKDTSELQILERRQLSSKTTVYLLSVRGKGLVVAESSHGVQALGEVALAGELVEPQEAASLAEAH